MGRGNQKSHVEAPDECVSTKQKGERETKRTGVKNRRSETESIVASSADDEESQIEDETVSVASHDDSDEEAVSHSMYRGGGLSDLSITYTEFGARYLDPRVTRAVTHTLGLQNPTLIQSNAIPIILQGKDVLARARTGSGKTLAYAIPVVQKLLDGEKESTSSTSVTPLQACIIVPTRELCAQVANVFVNLCTFCHSSVSVCHTSENIVSMSQEAPPSILVSTPKALLSYLSAKRKGELVKENRSFWRNREKKTGSDFKELFRKSIRMIILDEADAMMSLGFGDDLDVLFKDILGSRATENRFQSILCSATLNAGVDHLKALILHKPAILKLEEDDTNIFTNNALFGEASSVPNTLSEYWISSPWKDKYLLMYALLKLSLVPMKCLIFTSTSERAYSLRLFLDRFSIRAAVVCATLPFASRLNIVQSFDQSLFEILIATDDFLELDVPNEQNEEDIEKKNSKKDKNYGIHRGLDLHGVRCVINYDMPQTKKSYVHRVGRTARAGASGVALTICNEGDEQEKLLLEKIVSARRSLINPAESAVTPLALDLKDIECFRYRVEDVLKAVTPKAITNLRAQELHREILHSKTLKSHFEANPEDADAIKKAFRSIQVMLDSNLYDHPNNEPLGCVDVSLQGTITRQKHLSEIPSYLKPSVTALATLTPVETAVAKINQTSNARGLKKRRQIDPLRDFVGDSHRKKRRLGAILTKQLEKEPDYLTTAPENLPAISGRKLYKIQRRLPLRKPERMPNYKRKRTFQSNRK